MNAPELARDITDRFNIAEIKGLCFTLDIEFEDLVGDTLTEKAIELVKYCKRHGKIPKLIAVLREKRPNIDWNEYLPLTEGSEKSETKPLLASGSHHSSLDREVIEKAEIDTDKPLSTPEVHQSSPDKEASEIDANKPVSTSEVHQSGLDSVAEHLRNIKALLIAIVLVIFLGAAAWVWQNFLDDNRDNSTAIQGILSVDWGPNGNLIASSGIGNSVTLWSGIDSDLILKLDGHTKRVRNVAWSNNGQLLASASDDKSVIIWDIASGTQFRRLARHSGPVRDISWSPDDTRLASASEDNQVRVWNISTGTLTATLAEHTNWVRAVSWSPDGKTLASVGRDKKLVIWDLETNQPQQIKEFPTSLFEVTWNHDGTQLAVAAENGEAIILRADDLSEAFNLSRQSGIITQVAWSPDKLKIATSSRDGTLVVWNSKTGDEIRVLKGHGNTIWHYSWSPDSTKIVSSGDDSNLIVWNAITGETIRSLKEN